MPHAERTITVLAPPATVFAFFTTPANDPRWRPGVKDIKAEGPPRVGGVVHQTVAGTMGRGIKADIEISAYEPTTLYAFRAVEGPIRPVGSYAFATTEGGTEVTFTLTAEVTGLKKMIMAAAVQKSMDGEMSALDTAKKILEASS